jgi:hypothetical protein
VLCLSKGSSVIPHLIKIAEKRRGYILETFTVKLIPVRNRTQQLSLMNKIIFVVVDPVKIKVVYFEIGIGRNPRRLYRRDIYSLHYGFWMLLGTITK